MSEHRVCCCQSGGGCGTCICTQTPFGRIRWTGSVTIQDDACDCPFPATPFFPILRRYKDHTISDGVLRLTAANQGCCGRSTGPIPLPVADFSANYFIAAPCVPQGCSTFNCDLQEYISFIVEYPSTLTQYWQVSVVLSYWGKPYVDASAPAGDNALIYLRYREAYSASCTPPNVLTYYGASYIKPSGASLGTPAFGDCLYYRPINHAGKLGLIAPGEVRLS